MGNRRSHVGGRRHRTPDRAAFLSELLGQTGGRREKPDHKTLMLCRQVQRTLSLALAGESHDDALAECSVGNVVPAPNAGHLLVELIVPATCHVPLADLLARAAAASPRLRHAIAQSITRKRAPELSFVPIAQAAGGVS